MREIYIAPGQYQALLSSLMNLKPANPFGGTVEEGDIMVALGEGANIWPASVLDDPDRGVQLKRANLKQSGEAQAAQAVQVLLDEDDF